MWKGIGDIKENVLSFVFNAERLQSAGGQETASWDHSENNGTYYGLEEFYNEQVQGATSGSSMTSTSVNTGKKGSSADH